MARPQPKYLFPWREHNSFQLLVDGQRYFPAIFSALSQARHSIYCEMYLVSSGRLLDDFLQQLAAARLRGVQVFLLLDDFGARGLSAGDRQRLQAMGAQLAFYNPFRFLRLSRSLLRDHRKLLVVDHAVAYTGGAGLTDDFWRSEQPQAQWLDLMVQARGPVVGDWVALFSRLWSQWSAAPLPAAPGVAGGGGEQLGRVVVNQLPRRLEVKRAVVKRVLMAERRVWLATAYFVPSLRLRRALRKAAASGVDVRLLLPGQYTDHPAVRHASRRYYASLLRAGVAIYEHQTRFVHAKMLLCDNWVSIGSSNIDRWGQRWNLDANQEIDDNAFAGWAEGFFSGEFPACERMQWETWRRRPWYRRLGEWFWGRIDRWIHSR